MSVPRKSVREIFGDAFEIEVPEVLAEFLDAECGDDVLLRERIELLLQASEADTSFMRTSAPELLTGKKVDNSDSVVDAEVGHQIGRYELIGKIGEGGMGVVFLALQQNPVQRKVALKLIKAGLNSHEFIQRFQAERQTLAVMKHPNIAKVLDGGTTETGLPYFVMEYVDGQPITEFCDAHQLSLSQRVSLLIEVCNAVQHAHQRGIVHSDLKPGNILVEMLDDKPVARIIDFGVSKVIELPQSKPAPCSSLPQIVGTPLYMSPEQVGSEGQVIDHRSDVYSLGVILYQLIAGKTPFDKEQFRHAGNDETRRIIREVDPPLPSVRYASLESSEATRIARCRATEPAQLPKLIRGELEWITTKAQAKDLTKRYQSPGDLAADLSRYLRHEAVLAGPPRISYRILKFIIRHRSLLSILLFAGLCLLGGIAFSSWQAFEAERARQQGLEILKIADRDRDKQLRASIRDAYAAWERREYSEASSQLDRIHGDYPETETPVEWDLLQSEISASFRSLLKIDRPLHEVRTIPDSDLVAAVGGDGVIYIVDTEAARTVRTIETGVRSLHALAVSKDGTLLAVGGVTDPISDRSVPIVFDVRSGQVVAELAGQLTTIESLIFSADNRFLLCGSRYEKAVIFDLESKQAVEIDVHDRHRWFSISDDGRYFAAQKSEQTISIIDAAPPFQSHDFDFLAVPISAVWIPDSDRLVTFLDGNYGIRMTVQEKYGESYGCVCDFSGAKDAECVALNSHLSLVAAGLVNGDVMFWPLPDSIQETDGDEARIQNLVRFHLSDRSVTSMVFRDDWLIVATENGELLTVRPPAHSRGKSSSTAVAAMDSTAMAWSPDGETLFAAMTDGTIRSHVMSSAALTRDHELKAEGVVFREGNPSDEFTSLAIDANRPLAAVVRNGKTVMMINDATEKVLFEAESKVNRSCDALSFSPDGQYVAWFLGHKLLTADVTSASADIREFDLPGEGRCLAWTSDAKNISVGGSFRTVVRINMRDRKNDRSAAQLIGNAGFETGALKVNHDGILISGHSDGALRFWVSDHTCRTLHMHDSQIIGIAVSPDGRIGASVDSAGRVAVWYASPGERIGVLHDGTTHIAAAVGDRAKLCFTSDGSQLRSAMLRDGRLQVSVWSAIPEK